LDDRSLRLLEFDKVLEWVSGKAQSEPGALALRSSRPFADEASLKDECVLLEEALARVAEPGTWCWTGPGRLEPALADDARDTLDGPALIRVRDWLEAGRQTREGWRGQGERYPALVSRWAERELPEALLRRLQGALEDDGRVADKASPELARLRREGDDRERRLKDQLSRWAVPFGENAYVTRAADRWVVLVPAAGFPRRRGIVHDVSNSGQSLFVEPLEACEANNQILECRAQAAEEERRILAELARDVRAKATEILDLQSALGHLDSLRARALWAREIKARVLPVAADAGVLKLRNARHPLLIRGVGADRVVPLDLELREGARVLLVSGPNMGGKTVLLKTVGLSAALAASAIPVAADEGSRLPRFTTILVEMGDDQSLEKGLSTFAAHLEAMARMAEAASPAALLLCDELGTGTDPEEGAALGQALLEHFAARGAWSVVTTHLGPLKRAAGSISGVVNGTLEFDRETLTPKHRFVPGAPGASYALAIAGRLGFPEALLARARALTPDAARALERLLTELESARRDAEAEARAARAATEAARHEAAVLQHERERAEVAERESRRRIVEDGDRLLGQVQTLLKELHKAVKTAAEASPRGLKQAAADLEREFQALRPRPVPAPAFDVVPGERARLLDLNLDAEVVSGPDAEGRVVLKHGSWRIQSHKSKLGPPGPGPTGDAVPAWQTSEPQAGLDVDVRGQESDDALRALDQALDHSVMAGLHQLRVVHGVGRGVLRAAVHAHLKGHPQVKTFRSGQVGEGGRGVTVVELE